LKGYSGARISERWQTKLTSWQVGVDLERERERGEQEHNARQLEIFAGVTTFQILSKWYGEIASL